MINKVKLVRLGKKHTYIRTSPDDLHPYECNHNSTCIHCARRITETHNPKTCAICNQTTNLA